MLILGIIDFWIYVLGVVFVILLFGLNLLFVFVILVQCGVVIGYWVVCGVFFGDVVLMLLLVFGVVFLLKVELMLFIGLKYFGVVYLFYFGVGMLWGVWCKLCNFEVMVVQVEQVDVYQLFCKVLLFSLLNFKVILFFIFFFIQFVDFGYVYLGLLFLVLVVILELVSVFYLSFLIFIGVWLVVWFCWW